MQQTVIMLGNALSLLVRVSARLRPEEYTGRPNAPNDRSEWQVPGRSSRASERRGRRAYIALCWTGPQATRRAPGPDLVDSLAAGNDPGRNGRSWNHAMAVGITPAAQPPRSEPKRPAPAAGEADREVRRARRIMRALDAGDVGVWEVDVRRDRVSWNQRTFEILGIEPHQFDGTMHGWLRLVEPDDLISTRRALADAMAGRRPLDHHFRIRRPDRAIRYMRISGQVEHDASGRATRICGVAFDVTRAIVAAASNASAESVEHSRRLHNEMLLRMGHDLRSPLNAMMGFAQLIERHPSELPASVRQHAHHIADAGTRLLGLVADLLDLSRIGVASPPSPGEGFDAAEALRRCADAIIEPARSRGIRVALAIEPSLSVRGGAESLV